MNPKERGRLRSPRERVGRLPNADLPPPASTTADDEQLFVAALRDRDEGAFELLLARHHSAMIRLAMVYLGSRSHAEEVVQETWLALLRGLDRFEGRSSLKTWIFRILVNRAKTYARREARMVPISTLADGAGEANDGPQSDEDAAGRRAGLDRAAHAEIRGAEPSPDEWVLSRELRTRIEEVVQALPPRQREVITLRDIEGWTAREACSVLDISETNQRVLLHRARQKVRDALEPYLLESHPHEDARAIDLQ